jgi:hypothetical protein
MARKIGSLEQKNRVRREKCRRKSRKNPENLPRKKTVPAGNPPGAGKNPPKIPRSP